MKSSARSRVTSVVLRLFVKCVDCMTFITFWTTTSDLRILLTYYFSRKK